MPSLRHEIEENINTKPQPSGKALLQGSKNPRKTAYNNIRMKKVDIRNGVCRQ